MRQRLERRGVERRVEARREERDVVVTLLRRVVFQAKEHALVLRVRGNA